MTNNLKNHYQNIITYDLITKFNFKNVFEIPKITKICLNIGFKNANIEKKKIINILVLLKLITNTNKQPILTKSTKNNIFLKIKKNSIIGCKIILKKNDIHYFLEKCVFFLLPHMKKIQLNMKNKNILNFQIKNILNFFEFKTEFIKFKNLPPIDVSIHNTSKNYHEFFSLLNSLYIIK